MSRLAVDPEALSSTSAMIRAMVRRLEPSLATLAPVGLGPPVEQVLDRLSAFADLVALVGDDFVRTEEGVAASFRPGPLGALLDTMPVGDLLALLDGSPALAAMVVNHLRPPAESSSARQLSTLLRSGEPGPVVLDRARQLLAGLSADDRTRLALLYPALISGLASAPIADRCAATRVLVNAERERLSERLRTLTGVARTAGERRLRWYGELLDGTVTLTRPDGTRLVRPHQLLAFDPRGDGQIEELFGDPARARHLAVYVPGTGTSLDRYAGNAERASAFAAAEPDLAVVLWQGADFPDMPLDHLLPAPEAWLHPVHAVEQQIRGHVLAAAYRDAADVAGPRLAHEVDGLRMALPGPGSDLTVLGHSYGGSIVASAEAHGMVVDRVVHLASAGGYVDNVNDYAAGACGTRRFSMTDPDDPIQLVQGAGFGSPSQVGRSLSTVAGVLPGPLKVLTPQIAVGLAVVSGAPLHVGHGLDPDLIPGVTRLDTGVEPDGHTLVSGHGGMFDVGSTAWRNVLAVMHGDPVQVLQPQDWHEELIPGRVQVTAGAGVSVHLIDPHYVVTRSPYDDPGYQPPVEPSTSPACEGATSW